MARTIDVETATSEAIRATIREALADEKMARRARAMAYECAGLPDVDVTVARLEALSLEHEAH